MKYSSPFIGILVFCALLITPAFAQEQTDRERYAEDCTESLNLSELQIERGFYDYQIEQCIQFKIREQLNKDRIQRVQNRLRKVTERSNVYRSRAVDPATIRYQRDLSLQRTTARQRSEASQRVRRQRQEDQPRKATEEERAQYEEECIESLGIRDTDIHISTFKYQISRCVEFKVHRTYDAEHIQRVQLRLENLIQRSNVYRGMKLNPSDVRFKSLTEQESTVENTNQRQGLSHRARRRLHRQQTSENTRERREQESALRQERAQQARDACADVQSSFRENCVRNMLRRLGE